MKTTKQPLFGIVLLLVLALPFVAEAQFTYTTNNDTTTITGYTGPGGLVKVPDTINGLSVTSLGDWAFANVSSLTSVTIPNSINTIGNDAFYGCSSLTAITVDSGNLNYSSLDGVLFDKSQTTLIQCPGVKAGSYTTPDSVATIGNDAFGGCTSLTTITIGNSVNTIGNGAFSGCTSLTNFTLPDSVATIGSDAFAGCSSLTAITVDPGNPNYSSLNGVLFDKSQTTLIQCPGGKAGTYTTPDSIATIGNQAFGGCTSLTNMTIGNSVNTIGNQAFLNCSSLGSIAIGSIVSSIGDQSFDGCTSLTAISVNAFNPVYTSLDGVLFVNSQIFDNSQTTLITCPEGKAGSYTIPSSVIKIGDSALSRCGRLTDVTIGNSVTNIGFGVFDGCTSLAAIIVDPGNSSYSSLEGVLFDKSQTKLIRCPEGKAGTCTISSSVVSIGQWILDYNSPFSGCTSLTAILVDPLNSAFTSVDGVLFDNSRTMLLKCPPGKVGSYTIPDGVIIIGEPFVNGSPFSGCINLTSVTFPSSVTCVCSDAAAFSYCTSLTAAYFHGNQPEMHGAFSGDSNVTLYYLPGTTGWSPIVAGRPTALWLPQAQTSDASFGLRTNQFGFNITWASGMTVVVEATPTLANPTWSPLATNTLTTGSSYFSDPRWTNHPTSFYRLRMP